MVWRNESPVWCISSPDLAGRAGGGLPDLAHGRGEGAASPGFEVQGGGHEFHGVREHQPCWELQRCSREIEHGGAFRSPPPRKGPTADGAPQRFFFS
jgi:hypothetical protein